MNLINIKKCKALVNSIIASLILVSCAFVDYGISVGGEVVDADGKPIENAKIAISNVEEVTTNAKGRFCISRLYNDKSFSMSASRAGYDSVEKVLGSGDYFVRVTLEKIGVRKLSKIREIRTADTYQCGFDL